MSNLETLNSTSVSPCSFHPDQESEIHETSWLPNTHTLPFTFTAISVFYSGPGNGLRTVKFIRECYRFCFNSGQAGGDTPTLTKAVHSNILQNQKTVYQVQANLEHFTEKELSS